MQVTTQRYGITGQRILFFRVNIASSMREDARLAPLTLHSDATNIGIVIQTHAVTFEPV